MSCSILSAVTMTPREPLAFCGHAPAGPRFYTLAEPFRRPFRHRALAIGARRALEHAPAAHISGLAQSQELYARIWPGFDEYDIDGGLRRSETESDLISGILPNASIYGSSNTPSQKSLPAKIEVKACCHLLDLFSQHTTAGPTSASIVSPELERGFSPSRTPSSPTSLFPYFGSASAVASACHLVPEHELHALRTSHGQVERPRPGSRMRRRSGHSPQAGARRGPFCCQQRGEPGHYPGKTGPLNSPGPHRRRSPDPHPSDPSTSSRRSADVWVPRRLSGGQEAWDFSIASALRLGSSLPDPSASISACRVSQCSQAGISFCPLVLEAAGGGWSDSLRSVVSGIVSESKLSVAPTQASRSRRISCTVHRENARS